MSTRTNVTIRHGETRTILYRHCDGYLAETGANIVELLRSSKLRVEGLLRGLLNESYDATTYSAARPIYELTDSIHGDIEHEYEVIAGEWPGKVASIRHRSRLFMDGPGFVWTEWNSYDLEGFAALVNEDRDEHNGRLADLKDRQPKLYADAEPYPMLEVECPA